MKLRVFLSADEHPQAETSLGWVLLDARGSLLRAGRSAPAEMPRAGEVEAILPASRVLFARLRLPRVNAATIRELLPYAVEDRLLTDPANIHAVAGVKSASGETLVAVVDRSWLTRALASLSACGLSARRAACESALLAGGDRDWHVVLGAEQAFLVDDEGASVAFDRAKEPDLPLAVRVALDEAAARSARPHLVRVHAEGGAALPDLARWSEQSGVAFEAGSTWDAIASGGLGRGTLDLLQGLQGTRTARASSRLPRAAVALAAGIVVLQFALTAADAWRLSRRHAEATARAETIFREAFPEARAVVDPALQMARNLSELRRSRGLAAADDFLAQATRAAREFPAGSARELRYASGRLDVVRGERVAGAEP